MEATGLPVMALAVQRRYRECVVITRVCGPPGLIREIVDRGWTFASAKLVDNATSANAHGALRAKRLQCRRKGGGLVAASGTLAAAGNRGNDAGAERYPRGGLLIAAHKAGARGAQKHLVLR